MNKLEKLFFHIGVIDAATGPVGKITASVDKMYGHATKGMAKLATGGVGLYAVGRALDTFIAPVKEMDRALGELRSLDVSTESLEKLERTALRTSMQYGLNATDIVRSSYDIQSAIAGLTGAELGSFTQASAILAKGTKADASVITDYMGTMYGIFQTSAAQMGKAKWVEVIAGQTASAVKMFKTNGVEMSAAFGNLGAEAQSQGVKAAEQMAILGTLQATMSGSESGTKYKSFLANVGKAQDTLNLRFVDSNGKMLSMIKILDLLKGKFGAIDTVAESDLLKKAFGSKEAVSMIKLLMQDTDKLASNIEQLDKVSGMNSARKMAQAMVDPWEQMAAASTALKTSFGRFMQPVLMPLINAMIKGSGVLMNWIDDYPVLARVVAIATLGIIGLVAVVSTFAIIGGIASLTVAGFNTVMVIGNGIALIYSFSVGLIQKSIVLMRAAALAGAINVAVLSGSFSAGAGAAWLFTAALLANPITWVVVGVVALIASLALLVIHWDAVTAAVVRFASWFGEKWAWIRGIIEDNAFLSLAFSPLLAVVDTVSFVIDCFKKIPDWWKTFKGWLGGLNPFEFIGSGIDWLIEKINLIPGIEIGASTAFELSDTTNKEIEAMKLNSPSLQQSVTTSVPAGGLMQQVTNTSNQGISVGELNVTTTQPVNGFSLVDELQMAAG